MTEALPLLAVGAAVAVLAELVADALEGVPVLVVFDVVELAEAVVPLEELLAWPG